MFNQVLEKVTGAPAEVPEAVAEPEAEPALAEEKPKGRKKAKA